MMKDLIGPNASSLPEEISELGIPALVYPYSAGVAGGLLGGLAMTIPALVYGVASGHGPWYPVNLVAATLLPEMRTLPPTALNAFDPIYLAVGLAIHLTVATGLGLIFAMLLPTLPGRPHLWALVIGPLLWLAATAVVLPTINPLMSNLLDWPSFGLANIVYGLTMGLWVARAGPVPA